jgi:hypothetical protein
MSQYIAWEALSKKKKPKQQKKTKPAAFTSFTLTGVCFD